MMNDYLFGTAREAFLYIMTDQKYGAIVLYARDSSELHREVRHLCERIRKYNSRIANLRNQIALSNPYFYSKVEDCLPMKCAEITYGQYSNVHGAIGVYTGWNTNVLVNSIESAGMPS